MIGKISGKFKDHAPLMLRIMLGVIFIYHGSQKLFGAFGGMGFEGTKSMVAHLGFFPTTLWALLLGLTEFVGGIFVLVGFLTRYAASMLCVVMLVAIFRAHGLSNFGLQHNGFEYAFACLMAAVSLVITGAGKMSIDAKAGDLKEYV